MGYPGFHLDLDEMGADLAKLSRWIDDAPANAERDSEARTWGRIAKVAEESGEAIAAFIGMTGQNPRKGYTHHVDEVCAELLDVALTALAAYEHLTGNAGSSARALREHIKTRNERAGI